jgi:hypothetical protein
MTHDPAVLLEQSDAAVAYVIEAETVFNALRRLIGKLSGLLILAETKTLRSAPGLADLAAARSLWAETEDAAARLEAPGSLARHAGRLRHAARHVGAALEAMSGGGLEAGATDLAARHLKHAYRLLQSAADPRAGLAMIDMSEACCRGG